MKSKEKTQEGPIKLNLLKGLRVRSGLTVEEMGKILGINRNNYNCKENGNTRISLDDLIIISKALNLSLEEIIDLFKDNYLKEKLNEFKLKIEQETEERTKENLRKLI